MGLPVGRTVILVCHEIGFGVFPGQTVHLFYGAVGSQMAGGQHDFRSSCLQDFLPFDADGFRHGQEQLVSFDGTDQCQPDTCISAGGLDNGFSGSQPAGFFSGFDHVPGRSVLDRAAGVEILQLGKNLDTGVGIQLPNRDKGGVDYGIQYRSAHGRFLMGYAEGALIIMM